MTWAFKRQIIYAVIVIFLAGAFGISIIYPSFNKEPSCTDGRQNGDERGVDCGGVCARECLADVKPISVLWARSFEVVPGRYNAIAYLENPNKTSAIQRINYRFRFADEKNIYIGKRDGSTYIMPAGRFAIFEPAVDTGHSIPVYTTIEFTEIPVWVRAPEDKLREIKISYSDINLENTDSTPRLSATVRNSSLFNIPNLNVVAILYDAANNAISASRTVVSNFGAESSTNVDFTWPKAFDKSVVRTEILPMYDVFNATVR